MRDSVNVPLAASPLDARTGLIHSLAGQLIPLFQSITVDLSLARQMAISAIAAYQPETRADFVNVARTIAFSMAALSLLGQVAARDMTMAEKLRAFGRANALNRSADQSERTMMQRRRCQQANPSDERPDWINPEPATSVAEADLANAEIDAVVAEAVAAYCAHRAPAQPGPLPPQSMTAPLPKPVVSPSQPIASMPASVIRNSTLGSETPRQATAPLKQELMRNSAIQMIIRTACHIDHPPGTMTSTMVGEPENASHTENLTRPADHGQV